MEKGIASSNDCVERVHDCVEKGVYPFVSTVEILELMGDCWIEIETIHYVTVSSLFLEFMKAHSGTTPRGASFCAAAAY